MAHYVESGNALLFRLSKVSDSQLFLARWHEKYFLGLT